MEVSYAQLKDDIHRAVLTARSIEQIVTTTRFERIWKESTEKQRAEVIDLITRRKKRLLLSWLRMHPSIELGERSAAVLKTLAQRYHIKYWSRMCKPELIREIQKVERELDEIERRTGLGNAGARKGNAPNAG